MLTRGISPILINMCMFISYIGSTDWPPLKGMLLSFNPYAFKKFADLFNPQPPGSNLKHRFPGYESEDGENNNSREEGGY